MTSNVMQRMMRIGAAMLVVAVSVLGVGVATSEPAAAADVGMSKPVYGKNEAVIVAVGMTDYVRNCSQVSGADIPVDDWLYGVSDLYVVPSSSTPSGALTDVSGSPNVVFGQMGGAFVDEVIGYTAPGGSIPPGRYGVVIDNCQDKHFDPAVDTFIPDAFRVTSEVMVPPLNIAALKADAERKAGDWEEIQYTFTGMAFAATAYEQFGALTDPTDMLIFLVTDAFVKSAGLPDAKAEAMNLAKSTARHWGGIAADPPNYAYDEPVSPGRVPVLESTDTDPVLRSMVELGQQAGVEGSLAGAFLESIEKYQGAARDRNGVWARQQARAAQRYARALAAQLPASAAAASDAAAALRADTSDVDDVMSTIGDMLIDARTNGIGADVRREAAALGMSDEDLQKGLFQIDNLGLAGISKASMAADLDDFVAQTASTSTNLNQIGDDLDAIITQLDNDPLMTSDSVTAHAGGPYSGATGTTVGLDASASTGSSGTLGYAWDLNGDGVFDDATGATPSLTVAADTPALVSVQVTGIDGIADVATAPFTNTAPGSGPVVSSRTPTAGVIDIEGGDTVHLGITPTSGTTTSWWVNASEVSSGNSFDLVTGSGDVGSRQVTAFVTDANGHKTSTSWWVKVSGVDADGDGWPIPLDCNDSDATINPGMPDIANGVDDDCDPSTSDGTPEPVVTLEVDPDLVAGDPAPPTGTDGFEGSDLVAAGTIDSSSSGTVQRRIDWGDGTVDTDSVSRSQFTSRPVSHTYVDDGTYTVELCGKYATSPWGCALEEITIANVAPAVNFVDLTDWTAVDFGTGGGRADWQVSDGRDSVLQTRNSDASVFLSPDSYVDVEATVELSVQTTSDDDLIGFVIGGSPDMFTSDDAHYLILDWKQGDQQGAMAGLRAAEVHGALGYWELWHHGDNPTTSGSTTSLGRGRTLGSTGWADLQTYRLRFRYTPDRFQVWVDDDPEPEIDVTGDFPVDARFGFYNYSQQEVLYKNFAQSGITVDEGDLVDFPGRYADPGVNDTHTGLYTWGDGSPADRVELSSVDGVGTASASHPYVEDGTYVSELCVTDNAGDTGCRERNVYVNNVAPVVDAGRDRTVGPNLILDDSRFTDAGVLDTHTATVDWGDGSPVEDVVVSGDGGSGVVAGAHTYTDDGTFDVKVCVTDDDGGVGCDTFEVTMLATNRAMTSTGEDDITVDEGDLVSRQVAFEDENPTDTHTATIDWGDDGTEAMAVADGGAIGVGTATHRYADDGAYTVRAEVCDDRDVCTTATSVVTVRNVAPTIEASDGGSVTVGDAFTFTGSYGDPGTADTHTGSVDWGDEASGAFSPDVGEPGAGTFTTSHTFTDVGEHAVRLCVADDDGGKDCAERTVTVLAAPVDPDDPAEPVEPGAPTDPVDPTVPASPAGPAVPTPEPVAPVEPGAVAPVAQERPADPEAVESSAQLPATGSSLPAKAPFAVLAMLAGALMVLSARRKARRPAD